MNKYKKYKYAIFDLDGTLLNTLEDLKNSVNYSLKHFSMPEKTTEEIRLFLGNGAVSLFERSVPNGKYNPLFNDALNLFSLTPSNDPAQIILVYPSSQNNFNDSINFSLS